MEPGVMAELAGRTGADVRRVMLTNEHIAEINRAIDDLNTAINENPNVDRYDVTHLKGFLAEEWHARTFNINAVENYSENRAYVLNSNGKNSVDVATSFGTDYSLKYRSTADRSVSEQSRYSRETGMSDYHGMERLIPSDQLENGRRIAERRVLSNSQTRPVLSAAYEETAKHLTDRISDSQGSESIPLSLKTSEKMAKESKTGSFDAENYGIYRHQELRISFVRDGLRAGFTAAGFRALLQTVPELFKADDFLIKNKELDISSMEKSGKGILSAGGEGFLQGSVAYLFTCAIQQGWLGTAAQTIDPALIGAMTAVLVSTVKSTLLLYRRKISFSEAKNIWVNTVFSCGCFLGADVLTAKLNWQITGFPFFSGSLLACALMAVYSWGREKFISFVERSGFLFFGPLDEDSPIPAGSAELFNFDIEPWTESAADLEESPDNRIREADYESIRLTIPTSGLLRVSLSG